MCEKVGVGPAVEGAMGFFLVLQANLLKKKRKRKLKVQMFILWSAWWRMEDEEDGSR